MEFFQNYKELAPDAIFGISERFRQDKSSSKHNLSMGIYYDEEGEFFSMPVVTEVAKRYVNENFSTAYQSIGGYRPFLKSLLYLLVGDESIEKSEKRVAMIQTIGGTSALRTGADFLLRGGIKQIYVSDPTWANHRAIFEEAGLEVGTYPYAEPTTMSVDYGRLKNFVVGLKEGSALLLHACCHNPTGLDLNKKEWEELLILLRKKKCICFFDMAYLGFAHGVYEDSFPLRFLTENNIDFMLAFSCSKTFTLYGERVGALMINTGSEQEKQAVESHIKQIARRTYSNPPRFGAHLVHTILSTESLRKQWEEELSTIRKRIEQTKVYLVEKLKNVGSQALINSLKESFGFFTLLGLSPSQVENLYKQGIYLTGSSRINLAALNSGNIDHFISCFCKAIQD
ncbi:aromatic amino acid aminotransferase [Candidatus Aerophobetes bacterium]|uniref:Aromatic amino acid aminotransferase n=1 Tax=Aerophobetes bacterium TaxID=2030807 RepID=A0A2A4X570_UNCAE|nr:MAG: aromatic amino acid aminotransferase [Candidatus Aerophobetes bacterium]